MHTEKKNSGNTQLNKLTRKLKVGVVYDENLQRNYPIRRRQWYRKTRELKLHRVGEGIGE